MLWPLIFWLTGLVLGRQLQPQPWLCLAGAGLVFVSAVFIKRFRPLMILLLFLIFGGLRWQSQPGSSKDFAEYLQARGQLKQELSFSVERESGARSYQVHLHELAGHPLSEDMLLHHEGDLMIGASYHALAEILPLVDDPILDIYPHRYQGVIRPILPLEEVTEPSSISFIHRLRHTLQSRLDTALGAYAPLAQALLLSDTDFKREHRLSLSRAGIMHLVVVSGLHVLMLSLFLLVALRAIFVRRVAELVFMVLLVAFAALNNWAPPILRAMLMINLALVARWLSRPLSITQNLSVSLFIITVISPAQLFSLSLQLSFVAVALIAFALPRLKSDQQQSLPLRMLHNIGAYMLLSLVVGIGISPLTLYYFGTASLNGVLANLLGLPLILLLLALGILILILPIVPFVLSFEALADLWALWLDFCARLPLSLEDSWISLSTALALGLGIVLAALIINRRWRIISRFALAAVPAILLLILWPRSIKNELYIFRSGVSDCALIFADDGSSMMIDTGGLLGQRAEQDLISDASMTSWLKRHLLVWLKRRNISELDYLVITHLHGDHAGGLSDILKQLRVKNLILSDDSLMSPLWAQVVPALKLEQTRILAISDTISLSLGTHVAKFLHPDQSFQAPDLNNQSLVLSYDTGSQSFLFTGDIEAEAELYLCEHYPEEIDVDILKVAHHGSQTSSTPEFIDCVSPQIAIINSSQNNVYGFPHPETIARLQAKNVDIRYTYEGSVRYRLK